MRFCRGKAQCRKFNSCKTGQIETMSLAPVTMRTHCVNAHAHTVMENEKKIEPYIGIASDLPQTDPDLDEFGYAEFARLLAKSIRETPSPQGLVMAIHGPWGSGKSSLLNFVKKFLSKNQDSSCPVVIDFNPWWFDDRNQLASQFLATFSKTLKLGPSNISKAGDLMAEYADALGKAVAFSTGIAWIDVPVTGLLKLFKQKTKDIPTLKQDISKALSSSNRRYVFVIDDIDRLTPNEIREVFKVIKALADFPNVVYLLSFDRAVVAKAIAEPSRLDGDAYLEKIIQAPFSLPPISPQRLHRKLFSNLDILLAKPDDPLFDQVYWHSVFQGMAPLLTKPRDVIRYTNILNVTYPALKGEVNPVDFFALELLRLTLPELYSTIHENPQHFTGLSHSGLKEKSREKEAEFHDAWVGKLDASIRSSTLEMLEEIFPRLSRFGHSGSYRNSWRRTRRAASADAFPTYFSFTLDSENMGKQERDDFVNQLSDKVLTQQTLLEATRIKRLDGSSKAKEYLETLLDYDEEIDAQRAANTLQVLANIGDNLALPEDEARAFALPALWRVSNALQHVLARIPDEREKFLIDAFSNGTALALHVFLVRAIKSAKDENVEHGPSAVLAELSEETVEQLQASGIEKIRRSAANGTLLNSEKLASILYFWSTYASADEPKAWLQEMLKDKSRLPLILKAFVSDVYSSVGVSHRINFANLSEFLDLELIAPISAELGVSDVFNSDREREAVLAFNSQYSRFKNGEDSEW